MKKKTVPAFERPVPKNASSWNDTRGIAASEKRQDKAPPDQAAAPIAIDGLMFRFSGASVDHGFDGKWDWDLSPKESHDILDLLATSSQHTWGEIKAMKFNSRNRTRALHHDQPVESIDKVAQRRLEELGRGDQETIFRLRHGNTARLWGVVDGSLFHVLWYDRDHKVCPSES